MKRRVFLKSSMSGAGLATLAACGGGAATDPAVATDRRQAATAVRPTRAPTPAPTAAPTPMPTPAPLPTPSPAVTPAPTPAPGSVRSTRSPTQAPAPGSHFVDFTALAAQDPLSVGGVWSNNTQGAGDNVPPGNMLSMRVAPSSDGAVMIAQHALVPVTDYNDAFAFVPNISSAGNMRVTAVVYRAPGYNPSANHELEIILGCRTTSGGNHRWIECLWSVHGAADIANLDGGPGSFTILGETVFDVGPPKDGDVWVAELHRATHTVRWYVNGALVCRATNPLISNLGSGAGIAAFRRGPPFGTSDSAALGFRSFRADVF